MASGDVNAVIGIDAGTTYLSVGRLAAHRVELIADGGALAIPAYIAYQDGEWQVGSLASELADEYPKATIHDIKRMLGCSYDMTEIQAAKKTWLFPVVRGPNDTIQIEIQEESEKRLYYPYELWGKVLAKLTAFAETVIRRPVTGAVITVPAAFNASQREDTQRAAEAAGLNVLRLVKEPTAAAIGIGYATPPPNEKLVLMYDFGGGTLDVSLLKIMGPMTWARPSRLKRWRATLTSGAATLTKP
jgi:molecular chaperone DnaK (HSP70)